MKTPKTPSLKTEPSVSLSEESKVRKVHQQKVYYSFLSFVLIICLIQVIRGVYLNVAKYITLNSKLHKLEQINAQAEQTNIKLKRELKDYTSFKGVEELARNNLNMAGKDEVLVIIKPNHNPPAKQQ